MSVAGLRPSALLRFYLWRLRLHPVQELFAASGIAIGVALFFAVQVANTSIAGSAERVVGGIAGAAELRVVARSQEGFDESVLERASRSSGRARRAPSSSSGRRPRSPRSAAS